ncbi:MAG: NADH-ubiquinone oxidoreductase-F iron-sulfur binding region domain-containing protein, partial [Roseiflexaceae bacterium]
AQKNDIAKLHDIYNQMAGNCFCLLGESAVVPIRTALKLFPHEFEEALAKHARHDIPLTLAH